MPGLNSAVAVVRDFEEDRDVPYLAAVTLLQVARQAQKLVATKGATPGGRGQVGVKVRTAFDKLGVFLQEGE